MELHQLTEVPEEFDIRTWEAQRLAAHGVPAAIGMRHRMAHFGHLFEGGYSAGYYSYTWAEAMDADGFDAFKEQGDIFHPETARRLREEVYATGNSRDPAQSWLAFRGREPTAEALLRNRGLDAAA
jgi:peptidyl-dipeptidase Dcp